MPISLIICGADAAGGAGRPPAQSLASCWRWRQEIRVQKLTYFSSGMMGRPRTTGARPARRAGATASHVSYRGGKPVDRRGDGGRHGFRLLPPAAGRGAAGAGRRAAGARRLLARANPDLPEPRPSPSRGSSGSSSWRRPACGPRPAPRPRPSPGACRRRWWQRWPSRSPRPAGDAGDDPCGGTPAETRRRHPGREHPAVAELYRAEGSSRNSRRLAGRSRPADAACRDLAGRSPAAPRRWAMA